jgi:serine/threonine-protein kinase
LEHPPERRVADPVVTLDPPPRDLLVGAVIRNQYRLVERIGEGGMGVIYRAERVGTGEALAIKLLHPDLGVAGNLAKRFEREAESVSRLSHPNIVKVVETGRMDSGALFLVMELLDGVSLADVLADHATFPVDRAVAILSQVLSALDHAHGVGIIHRDLKPENITLLRKPKDRVKVLDFGVAKIRDESTESEMIKLTKAGIVLGTPAYMSPEQASGFEVDHRSDLYTCGVLLFEMLTGVKPFVSDSMMELMNMHASAPAPTPRSVSPTAGIPPALEAIVMRALKKDPAERFQSAAAFLGALNQFAEARAHKRWMRNLKIGIAAAAGLCAVGALMLTLRKPAPAKTAAAPAVTNDDQIDRYLGQLSDGATCGERRDALARLQELGGPHVLDGLRAARGNKGFAKLRHCVTRRQLDDAIRVVSSR